jgi:hypothetical protein
VLWAINPHLIWHAQDVRNYAIWAAFSLLNMWSWLRVLMLAQPRRRDWALYVLFAALACNSFFLEAFIIVVQGFYLLAFRRERWRGWILSLCAIGVALSPLIVQVAQLASSGYRGAGVRVGSTALNFPAILLFGETLLSLPALAALTGAIVAVVIGLILVLVAALIGMALRRRILPATSTLLLLWIVVPLALLAVAATRLNVFFPRYLLASTPPLLIIIAAISVQLFSMNSSLFLRKLWYAGAVVFATLTGIGLYGVYYGPPKAPDWYALRDYLNAATAPNDLLLLSSLDPSTGALDPAYEYYIPAWLANVTLPRPATDSVATIRRALTEHRAVWYIPSGDSPLLSQILDANGVLIADDGIPGAFIIRQYRSRAIRADEIEQPLALTIDGARLIGYSVTGTRRAGDKLTVLLYWEKLPPAGLTTFVHLLGAPRADGSPLWAQNDHPPQLGRDSYTLSLVGIPAGDYQIEFGLYDSAGTRREIRAADGGSRGTAVTWPVTIHAPRQLLR